MKRSVVTAKGQNVIPATLRRKYGIKKGTPVSVSDRDGEIVLQPLTEEYFSSLRGIARTWGKGDLLKTLREFKKEEREL